jgi:hypothetical protein
MLHTKKNLFVIVEGLTEAVHLNSLASDFAMSIAEDDSYFLQLAWNAPPAWVVESNNKLLPLIVNKCDIAEIPYVLHLITFPAAIPKDFNLDDLRFTFTIAGLILVVDLSSETWRENSPRFQNRLRTLQKGGIRWLKNTNLPCVIVASSLDSPLVSIEEMRQAFGLSSKMAVLLYLGKTRKESRFHFFLTYDYQFVQDVLTTLIEQIEASNL